MSVNDLLASSKPPCSYLLLLAVFLARPCGGFGLILPDSRALVPVGLPMLPLDILFLTPLRNIGDFASAACQLMAWSFAWLAKMFRPLKGQTCATSRDVKAQPASIAMAKSSASAPKSARLFLPVARAARCLLSRSTPRTGFATRRSWLTLTAVL